MSPMPPAIGLIIIIITTIDDIGRFEIDYFASHAGGAAMPLNRLRLSSGTGVGLMATRCH